MDFCCLMNLALVACLDVLFDVLCKCWPPEAVEEGMEGQVVTFMTKVVMSFMEGVVTLWGPEDKLVLSLCLPSSNSVVVNKESFMFLEELNGFRVECVILNDIGVL